MGKTYTKKNLTIFNFIEQDYRLDHHWDLAVSRFKNSATFLKHLNRVEMLFG